MNEKNIINQSFLNTIKDFIQSHSHYVIVSHHSYNLVDSYLLISQQHKQHWTNSVSLNDFLKESSKLSLYYTQNELDNARRGTLSMCYIEEEIQKEFFNLWIKNTPLDYHHELFSIAGKCIQLSQRLLATQSNIELFKKQLTIKKKNIVKILQNDELQKVFHIVDRVISDEKDKKELLLKFCHNNSTLFNRIEAQNILNVFLQEKLSSFTYSELKKDFLFSLKDLSSDSDDYFEKTFPVTFLKINRKKLFSKLYNHNLTNKIQLNHVMEQLFLFFKDEKILKDCELSEAYYYDNSSLYNTFDWTFHSNCEHPSINYRELIEYLLFHGIQQISNNANWNIIFTTILRHYFLTHSIEDKISTKTKKSINKI